MLVKKEEGKGYIYKEDIDIYNECINRTYRDPELGFNVVHVFRLVYRFRECKDSLYKTSSRKFLATSTIYTIRDAVKEHKEDILYNVIDYMINNEFSWASVPQFLTAIIFPNQVDYETFGFMLESMTMDYKYLEEKEYKHYPILKTFAPAKKYLDLYNEKNKEDEFLIDQMGNVIAYIFKNEIMNEDLDELFKYIINNLDSLKEYYEFNKPEEKQKEEEFVVKTVEKILADYKKPNKLLLLK